MHSLFRVSAFTCRSGVMSSRIQNERPCVATINRRHELQGRASKYAANSVQRLPVVSIVKRNVDRAFRSGKEQTLSKRIFPHHVAGAATRNSFCISVHDFPKSRVRKCARANRRAERIDRAYAVPASKCEASIIETLLHGFNCDGVTFCQDFPPSRVM